MTEKISALAAFAAFIEDETLEKKSVEWAGFSTFISELSSKEKKFFLNVRAIVFDGHNGLETLINGTLTTYFSHPARRHEFAENVLSKVSFDEKISILPKISLYGFSAKDFKLMRHVNQIRNAFAHGYYISHKKYLYKEQNSKHIIHVKKVVHEFEADVVLLMKKIIEARNKIVSMESLSAALSKPM